MRYLILLAALMLAIVSRAHAEDGLDGSYSAEGINLTWSGESTSATRKSLNGTLTSDFPLDWDFTYVTTYNNVDSMYVNAYFTGDVEAEVIPMLLPSKSFEASRGLTEISLVQTFGFSELPSEGPMAEVEILLEISNLEVDSIQGYAYHYPVLYPETGLQHMYFYAFITWELYSPTGEPLSSFNGLEAIVVPEPSLLIGCGLGSLFFVRRR